MTFAHSMFSGNRASTTPRKSRLESDARRLHSSWYRFLIPLVLRRTSGIKKRYQELCSRLASLSSLDLRGVVDALFPENIEWAKVMREVAVLLLDHVDSKSDLLDELRAQV